MWELLVVQIPQNTWDQDFLYVASIVKNNVKRVIIFDIYNCNRFNKLAATKTTNKAASIKLETLNYLVYIINIRV